MGQQGSVLLASHQACHESGRFLPHGGGGVERGEGSCPPMGEPSINLVGGRTLILGAFFRRWRALFEGGGA